ncbi:hypothetical protein [Massilia aquatica]|uniref:Lipoprotein n=1 Tax=Massilia aquatica TaxID=2609000 RepID=A0ABX0MCQ2_9BURK|nr:hypothetical protein [Massilia aquatica]NHZ42195.1 hypothetical protein [Massilia aquatica]
MLISTLAGCYMPAARDDFSVLDNDVLSDLLRHSHESGRPADPSSGPRRVVGINQATLELLGNDLFLDQEQSRVESTFTGNHGECIPALIPDSILCSFVRKWRLKNIGARFDTSNWSDPAVKVDFTFTFDEHGRVQALSVNTIDVTVYKVIKG